METVVNKVLSFKQFINEGVNDPSIFKAIFLAGGPGSGKSFIVGRTALTSLGFKVINSDIAFENALKKVGLKPTPEDIYSPKGQEVRGQAKALTTKMMQLAIDGRLGLVIDGTGKDYEKIQKQADMLRGIGYEVAMIFVNTDLDTALDRNRKRERSLSDSEVNRMWKDVQKNLGKFQNFFRQKMFIVDNSTGSNYEGAVLSTYKKIAGWAKTKPASSAASEWIKAQRKVNEAISIDSKIDLQKIIAMYKKTKPGDAKSAAARDRELEVYKMRFVDNMTLGQIAKELNLSISRVSQIEEKAFRRFKKITNRLKEELVLEADQCPIFTVAHMQAFEQFVDRMFKRFNVNFEFTKHFRERMTDSRNDPCIDMKELAGMIQKIYKKYQGGDKSLSKFVDAEAVIKDMQTDLNMPIAVEYDRKNDELVVISKTIMRKKNFRTPNPEIKV
jgi:predicted kinase